MRHSSEDSGEPSGFMKGLEFVYHLRDFELLEKNSAPQS
jgi:hypothetical protein